MQADGGAMQARCRRDAGTMFFTRALIISLVPSALEHGLLDGLPENVSSTVDEGTAAPNLSFGYTIPTQPNLGSVLENPTRTRHESQTDHVVLSSVLLRMLDRLPNQLAQCGQMDVVKAVDI
jgi:hypothetical protein